MPGTILENLSNRKLIGVLSIILFIQITSFIIGGFISKFGVICNFVLELIASSTAPAPSSPEQYVAIQCVAENASEFVIPRDASANKKNCLDPKLHPQGYV